MFTPFQKNRVSLLSSACAAALLLAAPGAQGQTVEVNAAIITIQNFTGGTELAPTTLGVDISSVVGELLIIDVEGLINNSTTRVGGDGSDRNILSASLSANEAVSSIASGVTNDTTGVSLAQTSSSPTASGANASSFANLAIGVSQTADSVAGTVGVGDIDVSDPEGIIEITNGLAQVGIRGEDITTASAAVLNNVIEGIGTLNRSDSSIAIDGTNNTNASAGIASSQVATGSTLAAVISAEVFIDVEGLEGPDTSDITSSTVAVLGNTQRAVAIGNLVGNEIDVETDVNNLIVQNSIFDFDFDTEGSLVPIDNFDTTTASIIDMTGGSMPEARANAGYAISNTQVITSAGDNASSLSATVDGEGAGFRVGVDNDVLNSSVRNDNNTASANAIGNAADNTVSLSANNISVVGVEAVGDQVNSVSAIIASGDDRLIALGFDSDDVDQDIVEALAAALGWGFAVDSGSGDYRIELLIEDDDGTAQAEAEALLAQVASGPIVFQSGGDDFVFALRGGAPADGGALTQFAQGDQESGTIAAVANSQVFDATAIATAMVDAGTAVLTDIGNDVTSSSVSTSFNTVEAAATGNTASNTADVTATNINTTGTDGVNASARVSLDEMSAVSSAGITVSSAQLATGSITATLNTLGLGVGDDLGEDAEGSGAHIATRIGGDIVESTVRSDGNRLAASAVGNEITNATNLASVEGTNVATSTSVSNLQVMNADLRAEALLGEITETFVPGAEDQPGGELVISGTRSETGSSGPNTFYDFTFNLQQLVDNEGLAPEQETEVFAFWEQAADTDPTITDNGNGTFTIAESTTGTLPEGDADLQNTTPFSPTFLEGGFERDIIARGVTIEADGMIERSMVTVDANTVSGSVTGNIATNRVDVSAVNLRAGGDLEISSAAIETEDSDSTAVASADHALTNVQRVGFDEDGELLETAPSLSTEVYAAFALITEDPEGGSDEHRVTDSRLSVSGNQQFATSQANVATNRIDLSSVNIGADAEAEVDGESGDIGTGAALLSVQDSMADVSAMSTMEVYAPSAILRSTLDLSDNINQSVAVMNNVANRVVVETTNLQSISGGINAELGVSEGAQGDFVLNNIQTATTSVTAEANTQIFNLDEFADATLPTSGIVSSAVSMERNVTLAEGRANLSDNRIELTGGSLLEGTSGLLNDQTSSADVASLATTSGTIAIEGANDGGAASDASSVNISGNNTRALGRGNTATNVLNASALSFQSAGHGAASVTADTSNGITGSSSATFAVLNVQENSGNISARSEATYSAALVSSGNGNGNGAAILNSSIAVSGNSVSADAIGNSANNRMTLSALDQGNSSAGLNNVQVNYGNISAVVSNSNMGVNSGGSVLGSTVSVGSNTMSSSATGNLASSSIIRN